MMCVLRKCSVCFEHYYIIRVYIFFWFFFRDFIFFDFIPVPAEDFKNNESHFLARIRRENALGRPTVQYIIFYPRNNNFFTLFFVYRRILYCIIVYAIGLLAVFISAKKHKRLQNNNRIPRKNVHYDGRILLYIILSSGVRSLFH